MKLRTGGRNPLTLYVQVGDEPSDSDPCVGLAVGPETARFLCRLANRDIDGLSLGGGTAEQHVAYLLRHLGSAAGVRA